MAFKPNYGRDRAERARAARARSEKKSERETRKLRCAKPSAPELIRRRMKPVLDRTKSRAKAYAPGAAPQALPVSIQFSPFLARVSERLTAVEGAPAVSCRSMRALDHGRVVQHSNIAAPMSALGQKRRFRRSGRCPLLPPIATVIASCPVVAKCQ